jgi:ligand-binding sensor domain-containing protein
MACQKSRSTAFPSIVIALAVTLTLGLPAVASTEWETITSFKDVRRMLYVNDTLWAATSGGLLAVVDFDAPGRRFVNLDGLGTTDIRDIIVDNDEQKWLAGFGRLIRFDAAHSTQFLFQKDGDLLPLLCLADDGDNLWVGTSIGLVLFSKTRDGGQIQDSYGQFGNLNPNPAVNDILLVGDTIWIATSAGLAAADKTIPVLLKSPASWTVYGIDEYEELTVESIDRLAWFENTLYLATAKGLLRLEHTPVDTFTVVSPTNNRMVFDIKIAFDSLYVYYADGLGVIKDSTFISLSNTGLPSAPVTGVNTGSAYWVGVSSGGIFRSTSGEFEEYSYTGPPGNNVSGIAVNSDGVVTAGFTLRKAAQYNGEEWTTLPYDFGGGTMDVVVDSFGNAWIGTWGNGLWYVTPGSAINFDENNSSLRGIGPTPNEYRYVIVRGLTASARYIFAACYRAVNGYPVAIGDINNLDRWDSLGVEDGLTDELVNSLDYFGGRLAVGTLGNGVFVCYLNDDPFDAERRYCRHYTVDSGLVSNNVKVVRYAPDGNLWVGTDRGLSRWDLDRFVEVTPPEGIGPVITTLEFDDRGNMWIGSERNGLARVDGATGAVTVYTTLNSGLVSDEIVALALHPTNGDLYIATPSGISVLRSGVTRLTSRVEEVVAFPNPFYIRSDSDSLKFNYSRSATVHLFTIAGELVAEFPVNVPWDGRNQKGERVVSGVYVYVLTDDNGNAGRGKVLVIRE